MMPEIIRKIVSVVDSCDSIDQIDNAEAWIAWLWRKRTLPPGYRGYVQKVIDKRRKLIKGRRRARIFRSVRI